MPQLVSVFGAWDVSFSYSLMRQLSAVSKAAPSRSAYARNCLENASRQTQSQASYFWEFIRQNSSRENAGVHLVGTASRDPQLRELNEAGLIETSRKRIGIGTFDTIRYRNTYNVKLDHLANEPLTVERGTAQ